MVFLEFFYRLFSLDIGWLVSFILGNIFWLFAFAALAHFFFGRVSLPMAFVAVTIYIWTSLEIASALGWVALSAGFLSFSYIIRIIGLTFASTFDSLKNRVTAISMVLFFATLLVWNVFLV